MEYVVAECVAARTGVREVWRVVVCQGYDICDQAVYTRLDHGGTEPLQAIFEQVSRMLAAWVQPLVNAQSWDVLAPFVTQCWRWMNDVRPLGPQAAEPAPLQEGDRGGVAGQTATLFDVRLQLWQRIDYLADMQQNCKVHARAMLEGLSKGTLLLFDLGYFGFEWLDELTMRSLWMSLACVRRRVTRWCIRSTRARRSSMPWCGSAAPGQSRPWSTTGAGTCGLPDPRVSDQCAGPTHALGGPTGAGVCAQMGYRTGVPAAQRAPAPASLVDRKLTGILQQLWACLIIAQLLQAMRMEIAVRAHVDPFEVSMAFVVRAIPTLLLRGQDPSHSV